MGDQPERWDLVAEHLNRHMARTGLGPSELARRAGISTNTLRELLKVIVHKRRRGTLSGLALAFELPGDYFDEVLAGREPDDEFDRVATGLRAVERHVIEFRPDLVIDLDDETQILIEVRGRSKQHEVEVAAFLHEILRPTDGGLSAAERASAAITARLSRIGAARPGVDSRLTEGAERFEEFLAANRADAEDQTVEPRSRPEADAPLDQEA